MTSCTSSSSGPMVIGHRGAMGYETENTLASVQKALDLGVEMMEVDVFQIKSGETVVFHDGINCRKELQSVNLGGPPKHNNTRIL